VKRGALGVGEAAMIADVARDRGAGDFTEARAFAIAPQVGESRRTLRRRQSRDLVEALTHESGCLHELLFAMARADLRALTAQSVMSNVRMLGPTGGIFMSTAFDCS